MEITWHKLDEISDLPTKSGDYLVVSKYHFYRGEAPITRREILHYSRENGWAGAQYENNYMCSVRILYWSDILPFPEDKEV